MYGAQVFNFFGPFKSYMQDREIFPSRRSHEANNSRDFHVLVAGAGKLNYRHNAGKIVDSNVTCRLGGVHHCSEMQDGHYTFPTSVFS